MADESSEGSRYSYKKKPVDKPKKKQDESSEGKRYSYKKKTPKRRSESEQKDDLRRRQIRNNVTQRVYANVPHPRRPIRDLSENPPEKRPTPMIQPQVGVVGDMRSQVAHRYGYTPEAYKEMREIPARLAPPEDDFERGIAGYYSPTKGEEKIYINSNAGSGQAGAGTTLAHEQTHAWWNRRGMNEGGVPESFSRDFSQWRDAQPRNRESQYAQNQLDSAIDQGKYDEGSRPTEMHARVTEFSPNTMPEGWEAYPITDRNDWPDYVKPYYSGFLQGMDRLSTGEPTPPPVGMSIEEMGPDESGNYGKFLPLRRRW